MSRGKFTRTKQCTSCSRRLLQIFFIDNQPDTSDITMKVARICLTCDTIWMNPDYAEFTIVIHVDPIIMNQGSNHVKCEKCTGRIKKIKVTQYDGESSKTYTFGRICEKCKLIYMHPQFKVCKMIMSRAFGA